MRLNARLQDLQKNDESTFLCILKENKKTAWFDCSQGKLPISSKLLRNLRRLKAKAEKTAELRFELVKDPALLHKAFDDFLVIESSGWKGQAGTSTAIAHSSDLVGFYTDLLTRECQGVTPIISLLWLGQELLAGQLILDTPNCRSILKIGHNESYNNLSPGSLLLQELIADSVNDESVKKLSLVTCPAWSERWKPNTNAVYRCVVYNKNTSGMAMRRIDGLKDIARTTFRELKRNN
jgi:hypothetical protein